MGTEESRETNVTHVSDEPERENLYENEIQDLVTAESEASPVQYSGTDFDVEGLVRRLNRGDIVIPSFGHGDSTIETGAFQRGFVWRRPQMDRFIESLLLGYPIPGIMLVQQTDRRYLVLDGQQRLRTLAAYYLGIHGGKEFALENVATEFKNLSYRTLDDELRRQLDNTFIQATIVKTDGSRESLEAIYQVFERLNSGGTQLTPHEIRIALYPGELVDFMAELNAVPAWRNLYGPPSPRIRDQEIILRILASNNDLSGYFRPLKKYLNSFLGRHRNLEGLDRGLLRRRFEAAAVLLEASSGRSAIRFQSQQVNAALTEALFVGLMHSRRRHSASQTNRILEKLRTDTRFAAAISGSTSTEDNVKTRLELAVRAFAGA
jgi:hypothetical protein